MLLVELLRVSEGIEAETDIDVIEAEFDARDSSADGDIEADSIPGDTEADNVEEGDNSVVSKRVDQPLMSAQASAKVHTDLSPPQRSCSSSPYDVHSRQK